MPAFAPCGGSAIRFRLRAARLRVALGAVLAIAPVACVSGVPHPSIEAANLHYAAEQGHLDALEAKIRDEPSLVATRAADGTTLVHDAARHGRVEVLAFLSARGAPLDAQDRRGWTPLHIAASKGRDTAVSWLLAHGAKPDIRDARGETPLVLAVLECVVPNTFGTSTSVQRLAVVAALIAAGADPRVQRQDGRSLLEIAGSDSLLVAFLRSADPAGAAVGEVGQPRGGAGDSAFPASAQQPVDRAGDGSPEAGGDAEPGPDPAAAPDLR